MSINTSTATTTWTTTTATTTGGVYSTTPTYYGIPSAPPYYGTATSYSWAPQDAKAIFEIGGIMFAVPSIDSIIGHGKLAFFSCNVDFHGMPEEELLSISKYLFDTVTAGKATDMPTILFLAVNCYLKNDEAAMKSVQNILGIIKTVCDSGPAKFDDSDLCGEIMRMAIEASAELEGIVAAREELESSAE
jgi:hypothetical protein